MIRADTAKELAKSSIYAESGVILEDMIQGAARMGRFDVVLGFHDDIKYGGLSIIGKSFELFYERPANLTIDAAHTILSDLGYTAVIRPDSLGRPGCQVLHISWE